VTTSPPFNLTICLPIEIQPLGGLHTFLGNLTRYLERVGAQVAGRLDEPYDVLFVNSWVVPYGVVRREKESKPHIRVVQRIDGAARDYGRRDASDARQAEVNLLADLTIFQSEYGRYATTRKFRIIRQDGPVIYNPVDVELFRPDGECAELPGRAPRLCNVSFSVNPKKGTAQVAALAAGNPDLTFVLIGRHPDLPGLPNLHTLGYLPQPELPAILRACDLFLMPSENEACPNVVLEAMACGLPVLYLDSGGTPELVGGAGRAYTSESFRTALDDVLGKREYLAALARERAMTHFSPDVIFPRYLEAIAGASRRPLPPRWARLAQTWYLRPLPWRRWRSRAIQMARRLLP
jgi:glycosyltransferase involved in cell wall biosynthesis